MLCSLHPSLLLTQRTSWISDLLVPLRLSRSSPFPSPPFLFSFFLIYSRLSPTIYHSAFSHPQNMVSATATPTFTSLTTSHASSDTKKLSKDSSFIPRYVNLKLRNRKHLHQCLCSSVSDSKSTLQVGAQSQSQIALSHIWCSVSLSGSSLPGCATAEASKLRTSGGAAIVADKVNLLASEFNSLSEPIDRVKRLLHYAALLPPLEESARVPENRVVGCATQVWLVAEMDRFGRMRFRADSDSEISKGFCWCLVWMLDGAEPEEVLLVEKEDLADINVGLRVKAKSRVNTWHNVLFGMQKATKDLVLEMEGKAFPSLVVTD